MEDLTQIYEDYFLDVYYFSLALTKNKTQAEDITAETFLKALKAYNGFRGESSLRSWLFQIAKNTYYSSLKRGKEHLLLDQDLVDPKPGPEDFVIGQEALDQVQKIIEGLSKRDQILFRLRVFAGLSFKEIGRVIGMTENGACVRFYRLRKKLKEGLREENK